MKKLVLFFFVLLTITVYSQKPSWIEYANRTEQYPDSDYLTGFVSGLNTADHEPGKLMDEYEELAKSKVIQSIQVSIETNNSLTLSNINGKSGEDFTSKSISFSSATIIGLKAERYYDRKTKAVYAFAYVSKKELAYYNRKLITGNLDKIHQKLDEGREYLKLNDRENALKSFYEGMPLLTEAEEAQWLLMAVNREQFVSNDLKEIRQVKLKLNNEISQLQRSKELDMNEAAYFIAYGLFLQLGKSEQPILLDLCSYENTDLVSPFSEKWDVVLRNALIKTGQYRIQEQKNGKEPVYKLDGNYWEEGDQIRIHLRVVKADKLEASAEGNISIAWLEGEKVNYLPPQLLKFEQLGNIKLEKISGPNQIKIGKQSEIPFVVKIYKNESLIPIENFPLLFKTEEGKIISHTFSNDKGIVSAYFPSIQLPEGINKIYTQIDLKTLLNVDTNSNFYSIAEKGNPVTPVAFTINFVPLNYLIYCTEIIDRREVEIKTIEPLIKNDLSEKGFHFVDEEPNADFIIRIKAENTTGNSYQGIYFSFVDATLSLIDRTTGDEIYKTSLNQVKGGGSNSKKAAKKAYVIAAEMLKEKLEGYFSGEM